MKDRIELAKYFTELGFKVGAEIGILEGSYSRALCRYNPELLLYSIDGWDLLENNTKRKKYQLWYYERAKNKLAPHNVVIIKELSTEAVKRFENGSLDFVYIDASHSYPAVKEDITIWTPKVRSGGIVSGHDYNLPDVSRAVCEYAEKNNIKVMSTDCDKINPRTKQTEYSWYFIKP